MTSQDAAVEHRGLSDAEIDAMRAFVGQPVVIEQFNHQAGHDVVNHYAYGIGDTNPLWLDDEYGRGGTRFGSRVAPPTFVYSIFEAEVARGLKPGIQPLHTESHLILNRPIRVGEWVRAEASLGSVDAVMGRRSGRMARHTSDTRYYIDGEIVARSHQTIMCIKHDPSRGITQGVAEPTTYTEAELDKIRAEMLAEPRRGAEPRYAEDVRVGDTLPAVVKGPLDLMTMIAYYTGAANAGYRGVESRVQLAEKVKAGAPDAPTNFDAHHWVGKSPSLVHQDPAAARKIGMPGAFDNGNQRTAWCAHCVTNWMGDDADLLELRVRLNSANCFGDTLWITGSVNALSADGIAELDLTGVNQRGELTTTGTARVRLPKRG
jgi:acyl dehydratase